jgi:hypothetical protein
MKSSILGDGYRDEATQIKGVGVNKLCAELLLYFNEKIPSEYSDGILLCCYSLLTRINRPGPLFFVAL